MSNKHEYFGNTMYIREAEEHDADVIQQMTAGASFSDEATIHVVAKNRNAQVVAVAIVDGNQLTACTADERITFTENSGEVPDVSRVLDILQ